MSSDGSRARLRLDGVCEVDTFTLIGTPSPIGVLETPVTVKLRVDWRTTGPAVPRGTGAAGPAAQAFLGHFAPARAVGTFSGLELGFGFETNGTASSDQSYAEIGTERNGSFL